MSAARERVSAALRCRIGGALAVAACLAAATGCATGRGGRPSGDAAIRALVREARPIGRGPGFQAPATGPPIGACRRALGPRADVHVELFARDRVALVPAGIGVVGPERRSAGRIVGARCFGRLVTLDATGVVLLASPGPGPGAPAAGRPTLAALFRSWGEPLSTRRLGRFRAPAGRRVRVYVDGRRVAEDPRTLVLRAGLEIVLEVGAYVAPHHRYAFPPAP